MSGVTASIKLRLSVSRISGPTISHSSLVLLEKELTSYYN